MQKFNFKYGKKLPKAHHSTLALDKYILPGALPPPEQCRNWQNAVPADGWGMLGNDQVGNCVIAGIMHWIMAASANSGKPVTFTTQQALDLYKAWTGWNGIFGDPSDQGTSMTDAMARWQAEGVYGHKILGWAAIDYTDLNALRQGIDIFGGILVGTKIFASMEKQFAAGKPWNRPFKGPLEGLHCVPWLGYGREGQTCGTWSKLQPMDLTANSILDEAYVPISPDFLDASYKTPLGINGPAMAADLEALRITKL